MKALVKYLKVELYIYSKMFVAKEVKDEWYKWYLNQKHTMASCETYYSYIKNFIGDGVELNQKTIDAYMEQHLNRVCSGALKNLILFLVKKKDFPEETFRIRFEKIKGKRQPPKYISYNEVVLLVNGFESWVDRAKTIFIFELALRLSEVLKLKWEDFNWNEWIMNKGEWGKVNLKNTKRNDFRVIPVKPELMSMIYDAHKKRTDSGIPVGGLVFDMGVNNYINDKEFTDEKNLYRYIDYAKRTYRELLYKISKKVIGRRISPHYLRSGKAQMLMDGNMPIESLKEFLGHKSIVTTEIYAQASPEKVKRDLKAFDIIRSSQKLPISPIS